MQGFIGFSSLFPQNPKRGPYSPPANPYISPTSPRASGRKYPSRPRNHLAPKPQIERFLKVSCCPQQFHIYIRRSIYKGQHKSWSTIFRNARAQARIPRTTLNPNEMPPSKIIAIMTRKIIMVTTNILLLLLPLPLLLLVLLSFTSGIHPSVR